MQGDTLVHDDNTPSLDSARIPFEYSFRAETPQLLQMRGGVDTCESSRAVRCDVTFQILVNGTVYRELPLREAFEEQFDTIQGNVFALSAWGPNEDIPIRYSISNTPFGEGEFKYKDRGGWKTIDLSEFQQDHREIEFTVSPGFMAEVELTTTNDPRGNMSISISSQDNMGRYTHQATLNYYKDYDPETTVKVVLPIMGY